MDKLTKQKVITIYDDISSSHSTLMNEMKSNKDEEPKDSKNREKKIAILNTLMINCLKLKNLIEK